MYHLGSGQTDYIKTKWSGILWKTNGMNNIKNHQRELEDSPFLIWVTENGTERPFQNEYWNDKRGSM